MKTREKSGRWRLGMCILGGLTLAAGFTLFVWAQARNANKSPIPLPNSNELVALMLGKFLDDRLPLKLDASSVLPPVSIPEGPFQPHELKLTAENLEQELPPGDYALPVSMYCTKDSLHVAGRGVGYALAYMQGKAADALGMLYLRGAVAGVPWGTLQTISWSVQASLTYNQMPPAHQRVIDDLIPEYRSKLQGDFLQSLESQYNLLAKQFGPRSLPNFDQILSRTGAFGVKVAQLKRSREIIRRDALHFERLEQQLVNKTITANEGSPWAEVRPGIFARMKVVQGYHGLNWLEVRMPATAGSSGGASPLEILYGRSSLKQAAFKEGTSDEYPAIVRVAFVPRKGSSGGGPLISYPIQQPTQTHAIAPYLSAGGPPPGTISGGGPGQPKPGGGSSGGGQPPGPPPGGDPPPPPCPTDGQPSFVGGKIWPGSDQLVEVRTGVRVIVPAPSSPSLQSLWDDFFNFLKGCESRKAPPLDAGITIKVRCNQPHVVQFIHRERVLPDGIHGEPGTYPVGSNNCAGNYRVYALTTDPANRAWHVDSPKPPNPYYDEVAAHGVKCETAADGSTSYSLITFDEPSFPYPTPVDPKQYSSWLSGFVSYVLCNGEVIRAVEWVREQKAGEQAAGRGKFPEYSVKIIDPAKLNPTQRKIFMEDLCKLHGLSVTGGPEHYDKYSPWYKGCP